MKHQDNEQVCEKRFSIYILTFKEKSQKFIPGMPLVLGVLLAQEASCFVSQRAQLSVPSLSLKKALICFKDPVVS